MQQRQPHSYDMMNQFSNGQHQMHNSISPICAYPRYRFSVPPRVLQTSNPPLPNQEGLQLLPPFSQGNASSQPSIPPGLIHQRPGVQFLQGLPPPARCMVRLNSPPPGVLPVPSLQQSPHQIDRGQLRPFQLQGQGGSAISSDVQIVLPSPNLAAVHQLPPGVAVLGLPRVQQGISPLLPQGGTVAVPGPTTLDPKLPPPRMNFQAGPPPGPDPLKLQVQLGNLAYPYGFPVHHPPPPTTNLQQLQHVGIQTVDLSVPPSQVIGMQTAPPTRVTPTTQFTSAFSSDPSHMHPPCSAPLVDAYCRTTASAATLTTDPLLSTVSDNRATHCEISKTISNTQQHQEPNSERGAAGVGLSTGHESIADQCMHYPHQLCSVSLSPPAHSTSREEARERRDSASYGRIRDIEFEEILQRNKTVTSSAISRAVQDASTGEFVSAIETLVTAIALIKQSKISHDDRCRILISSLQDTLHGIESKSYGSNFINELTFSSYLQDSPHTSRLCYGTRTFNDVGGLQLVTLKVCS